MFPSTPISRLDPMYQKSFYDVLRPIVKAASFTEMAKMPYLRLYQQTATRLLELSNIQVDRWRNVHVSDDSIVTLEGFALNFQSSYEWLSLSLKLAEEIAYVEAVHYQLDINNTMYHSTCDTPDWWKIATNLEGTFELFLPYVLAGMAKGWRKYVLDRPLKLVHEEYGVFKVPAFRDTAWHLLKDCTYNQRRSFTMQRLRNALNQAHNDGWYIVFDTLTLADDRIADFYADERALTNYFRDRGRAVLQAEGRKKSESFSDCFQYFCVPEYGTLEGRLHFHVIYIMRTLPFGCTDPNVRAVFRNKRAISALSGTWPFGFHQPIAVRYSGDAFGRLGWLWPTDRDGKAIDSKPLVAVCNYVSKYVTKAVDIQKSVNTGGQKWQQRMVQELESNPKVLRVRMSRGFGMKVPSLEHLHLTDLMEMTQLSYNVTSMSLVLRQNVRRELRLRLANLSLTDILEMRPETTNLLKHLRDSMKATHQFNFQSFITSLAPKLSVTDISERVYMYLASSGYLLTQNLDTPSKTFGGK